MSTEAVCELVPPRVRVCLPGDPVLLLGPQAVVALGGGLRSTRVSVAEGQPSTPEGAHEGHATSAAPAERREIVLAEYCAPLQRRPHPAHRGIARYELESPATRRYQYRDGDPIVVLIARKVSQHYYFCYTAGPTMGYLDATAFDGATKTSKPRLVEGDAVYCYVKPRSGGNLVDHNTGRALPFSAHSQSSLPGVDAQDASLASPVPYSASGEEVELSCTAAEVGLTPKDWTSGEAVFGPLPNGRVLQLPLSYARSLLTPLSPAALAHLASLARTTQRKRPRTTETTTGNSTSANDTTTTTTPEEKTSEALSEESEVPASYLLALLGQRASFEVCVGVNGLVWVRGQSSASDATAAARRTVAVSAAIVEGQYDATIGEMLARVESYFPST